MTETPQPTAGSLSVKIIRACPVHNNKCKLECPKRTVDELGPVASFNSRPQPTLPNPNIDIKTGLRPNPRLAHPIYESGPSFGQRIGDWLKRITHPGGS